MDYSPGIRFGKIIFNIDKEKSLAKSNQLDNLIRSNKDGAGVAPSRTYELPQNISLWGFLINRPEIGLGGGAIYI